MTSAFIQETSSKWVKGGQHAANKQTECDLASFTEVFFPNSDRGIHSSNTQWSCQSSNGNAAFLSGHSATLKPNLAPNSAKFGALQERTAAVLGADLQSEALRG